MNTESNFSTIREDIYTRSILQMGTLVRFQVPMAGQSEATVENAVDRAIQAMQLVEKSCSRFDEESELRQLCRQINEPVQVSETLFHTLYFALAVAEMTQGVFDPTIGKLLHKQGFRHHYLTRQVVSDEPEDVTTNAEDRSGAIPGTSATYRDVELDEEKGTVLLRRPLTLDLGAVAKGFAVDLAARELEPLGRFVIDAGGDVYVRGTNRDHMPWEVGIRHPIELDKLICSVKVSDVAVCTSGGYERKSPIQAGVHHIVLPQDGRSPNHVLSSTVIAPYGMMADALSTAAFLLGPDAGIALLEEAAVEGLIIDNQLQLHMTRGMEGYMHG